MEHLLSVAGSSGYGLKSLAEIAMEEYQFFSLFIPLFNLTPSPIFTNVEFICKSFPLSWRQDTERNLTA